MPQSNVKIAPALPSDYFAVAKIENLAFRAEPIDIICFGPNRDSEERIRKRVENLATPPPKKGERIEVYKAVITNTDGKEEIIGAAIWQIQLSRSTDGEELLPGAEPPKPRELDPGANQRLYEDVFLKGDSYMNESCQGKDFAKLQCLVVSKNHQRQGIGSMLLEAFLKDADALGVQAVLGASPYGRGLYKKYGFVDYHIEVVDLSQYEGGEGYGEDVHVTMHRPAKAMSS